MAASILLTRRTSATETAAVPSASGDHREVSGVGEESRARRFETLFASHLGAAYDFARWLARNDRNAEDIVQEACLRAFKSLDGFHGDNGRAWLLAIVRNTYYTWFRRNKPEANHVPFDEDSMAAGSHDGSALESSIGSVERILQQKDA